MLRPSGFCAGFVEDAATEAPGSSLEVAEAARAHLPVTVEVTQDDRGDELLVVQPPGPPWLPDCADASGPAAAAFLADLRKRFEAHFQS